MTQLSDLMVRQGSNQVDVFPSLHVGVSLYLWLTLLKDQRSIAVGIAPLVFLLWVSTLYLRYHYLTDTLAGAALAVTVFLLTYEKKDAQLLAPMTLNFMRFLPRRRGKSESGNPSGGAA